MAVKEGKRGRATMQVGDRILVSRSAGKDVYTIARVEVPHAPDKAFASKSGFDFTIGVKVRRSDYVWNEKNRMWVRRD